VILPPRPAGLGVVTCSGPNGAGDTWANVYAIDLGTSADTPEVITANFFKLYQDLQAGATFFPAGWGLTNISLETGPTGGTRRFDVGYGLGPFGPGNPALPPQVALVASHKTEFTGPSRRGRTFLGPLTAGNSEGGKPSAASRAVVVSSFNVLRGDLAAAGRPLVVWSRVRGFITPVTATSCGPIYDTQRSRRSSLKG
jgi:hypothetical protein